MSTGANRSRSTRPAAAAKETDKGNQQVNTQHEDPDEGIDDNKTTTKAASTKADKTDTAVAVSGRTLKCVGGRGYVAPGLSVVKAEYRTKKFEIGDVIEGVPDAIADSLLGDIYVDKSNNEHAYWKDITDGDDAPARRGRGE